MSKKSANVSSCVYLSNYVNDDSEKLPLHLSAVDSELILEKARKHLCCDILEFPREWGKTGQDWDSHVHVDDGNGIYIRAG